MKCRFKFWGTPTNVLNSIFWFCTPHFNTLKAVPQNLKTEFKALESPA